MTPWTGLAKALGIDMPDISMEDVNPYMPSKEEREEEKTPEEISAEKEEAKAAWKGFIMASKGSQKEFSDGRRIE